VRTEAASSAAREGAGIPPNPRGGLDDAGSTPLGVLVADLVMAQ